MSSLSRRRLLASTAVVLAAPAVVARPGLAHQADPHDRALSAGRRRRHGVARLLREDVAQARPDHRGRQPARRRRHDRRGGIGPQPGRRLHADGGQHGRLFDRAVLPPEPDVRHGQGLRADPRDRQRHDRRAGDAEPAGEERPGADRARQVQARRALLRLVGLRRPDPSQLRDAEADDGRGDDPRALQGHQLLPGRSLREPRAGLDRQRAGPPAAPRGRQGALPRRHQQDALALAARRADHGRGGRAGLRIGHQLHAVRAQGGVARHPEEAERVRATRWWATPTSASAC